METLQEKIERASDRIDGFRKWLGEAEGSTVFANIQRGIKRNVIAMDYDDYDRVAAVVFQEPGNPVREGVITLYQSSTMEPFRDVEVYVSKSDRRTSIEESWEWPCDTQKEMYKFLNSVKMPDILLGGGLHVTTDSGPNSVPFVLFGKDSEGNVKAARFRYQEYLAPRDM